MIKHPAYSGPKFLEANLLFPRGIWNVIIGHKTHSLHKELHPTEQSQNISQARYLWTTSSNLASSRWRLLIDKGLSQYITLLTWLCLSFLCHSFIFFSPEECFFPSQSFWDFHLSPFYSESFLNYSWYLHSPSSWDILFWTENKCFQRTKSFCLLGRMYNPPPAYCYSS